MVQTIRIAYVQGTVRVGYSPPFFYYDVFIVCILVIVSLLQELLISEQHN